MGRIHLYQAATAVLAWAIVTAGATALAAFSAPYTVRSTSAFVEVWKAGPLEMASDLFCTNLAYDRPCNEMP